jgi:N-terminal acetyltransferase B complex non-catalytic subunit
MNLVAEHLMLIIDPVSNESSVTALLWLKHRPSDGSDKAHGSGVSSIPGGLTKCEGLSIQAHNIMADIILCVGDEERRSEPDLLRGIQALNEDLCETLEMQLAHVVKIENEALAVQGTLHALYTAYELGIMVMKFTAYLSRTKQDTYNTQEQANLKTNELPEGLLQAVFEKSTAIKKGLDESGWIDKILESVSHGEQASTDQPISIADTLKGIIDENFLEEWAGHVLESWRDSLVGFSNFKSAAKS